MGGLAVCAVGVGVGESGGGDVLLPLRGGVLVEHLDLDLVGVGALLVPGLHAAHARRVLQVIWKEAMPEYSEQCLLCKRGHEQGQLCAIRSVNFVRVLDY